MIEFTTADKPFGLYSGNFTLLENWIIATVKEEGKEIGEINIINCTDQYLLDINRKYLDHHDYTDVITFDYVIENIISGDVFISEDRIIDNAHIFNVSERDEFLRVIIHGVLHLCGYPDKTDAEKEIMRNKENFYLSKF